MTRLVIEVSRGLVYRVLVETDCPDEIRVAVMDHDILTLTRYNDNIVIGGSEVILTTPEIEEDLVTVQEVFEKLEDV